MYTIFCRLEALVSNYNGCTNWSQPEVPAIEDTFYREHILQRTHSIENTFYLQRTHSLKNTFYRERILQRTHSKDCGDSFVVYIHVVQSAHTSVLFCSVHAYKHIFYAYILCIHTYILCIHIDLLYIHCMHTYICLIHSYIYVYILHIHLIHTYIRT